MDSKNLLKKKQNIQLSETKSTDTEINPNLFISSKISDKISYLCSRIHEVEWSGILLYSIKGSIKNPENLLIFVEDIIPMDKGTTTTTEYSYNTESLDNSKSFTDRYIDYVNKNAEKNPEVLNWKIGHIHSHNNMGVFFSGTDTEELKVNCKSHNFYLSLIVNNKGENIAKIAINATQKQKISLPFTALDENGKEYNITKNTNTVFERETFIFYNCKIKREKEPRLDANFIKSVDDIIKDSEQNEIITQNIKTNNFLHKDALFSNFCDDENKISNYKNENKNSNYKTKNFIDDKDLKVKKNFIEKVENDNFNCVYNSSIEDFIICILNNGVEREDIFFEDFLNEINEKNKKELWKINLREFLIDYPTYFEEYYKYSEESSRFLPVLEEVIEIIRTYMATYNFLIPIEKVLERLYNELIED